jgi:hypothetical protein
LVWPTASDAEVMARPDIKSLRFMRPHFGMRT